MNILRPQDILVLLKLVVREGDDWTYAQLGEELAMSVGEVHGAACRAERSGLYDREQRRVNRSALLEFLVHGLRYMVPAEEGRMIRGIRTGHSAPFLKGVFAESDEPPIVWRYARGDVKGLSISPIYKSVPQAALQDDMLYRLLVLTDLLRIGRARERQWASDEMKKIFDEI